MKKSLLQCSVGMCYMIAGNMVASIDSWWWLTALIPATIGYFAMNELLILKERT